MCLCVTSSAYLRHDDQLLFVAGAQVREDGGVPQPRRPLLVVHEGLGDVVLLLDQPLGLQVQLLQTGQPLTQALDALHGGVLRAGHGRAVIPDRLGPLYHNSFFIRTVSMCDPIKAI